MSDYSINAVDRKVSYTGSAGLGPYAFSFEILVEDDVAVYLNETLLTKTTDYTVTINANGTGEIDLVTGGAIAVAPTASDLVVILGARDIERTTDFVTAGDLRAAALNEQLDALTIYMQQIKEEVDRSVKAPAFDPTGIDMVLPKKADRVNAFIAFDANGDVSAAVPSDDVTTLAEVATDIATLADIEDGTVATDAISDTAAIASDVTTVAGIAANVTAVAGNTTNINAVAADATDIGTVAANIADVSAVAAIDSDVSAVAAIDSDVSAVAADGTDIGTVAGISADVSTVAGISADVSAVAAIDTDVTAVADDATDIGTVAANIADVNTVADGINGGLDEASAVSYLPSGTSAVQTNVQAKLREFVSVKDFGAIGDGTTDDTAAIQAALDASDNVYIPDGNFAIESTIVLSGVAKNLHIAGDLTRTGSSTSPIIQVFGSRSSILGVGSARIFGTNNSPDGMLLVGPVDPTSEDSQPSIIWNRIEGLSLSGNLNAASKGIVFKTKQSFGGSDTNYFNWVNACLVENVEDGIEIQTNANGQMIRGVQFHRISGNAIYMNGGVGTGSVSDCFVSDISVHFSSSISAILKLEDSNRNTFVNIGGEPGGGRLLDFDADSTNNTLTGYDNTPSSSIDLGNNNVRIHNGAIRFSDGSLEYEEGTYTPTFTCTTSGTITVDPTKNTLAFTRVGRLVTITGQVAISAVSSPTGDVRISLPTTIDDGEEFRNMGQILIQNGAQNINVYGFVPSKNVAYLLPRRIDSTAPTTKVAGDFSGDEFVTLSVTYREA